MDDLKKLTEYLEYTFIKHILNALGDEAMSLPDAKKLILSFRLLKPFNSIEDAQQKMQKFTSDKPDFAMLKGYADAFHREQKVDAKVSQMQQYINENKIDEALQVAKG